MPVPKRKKSKARRNNRRSHQHLSKLQVQKCPRCRSPKLTHRVCASCGYIRDVEVVRIEEAK